jgi:hypothetical protein
VAYSNVIPQNFLWEKRNITKDHNNSCHRAENRARDLHIINILLHPLIFSLVLLSSTNIGALNYKCLFFLFDFFLHLFILCSRKSFSTSSFVENQPREKPGTRALSFLLPGFLLDWLFDPDNGGSTSHRNVSEHLPDCCEKPSTASTQISPELSLKTRELSRSWAPIFFKHSPGISCHLSLGFISSLCH